jgi:tetratricopeptide (TPR) repeat protein
LRQALARFDLARGLLEELVKQDPANMDWQAHIASVYNKIAYSMKLKGDLDKAFESYQKALTLRREIRAQIPSRYDAIVQYRNCKTRRKPLFISRRASY